VRWAFLAGDGSPVACPAGQGRPTCLAGERRSRRGSVDRGLSHWMPTSITPSHAPGHCEIRDLICEVECEVWQTQSRSYTCRTVR
jgi:hypothetical protein